MSAKTVFPAALVLTLLNFCAAHGQNASLPVPGRDSGTPISPLALPNGGLPSPTALQSGGPSAPVGLPPGGSAVPSTIQPNGPLTAPPDGGMPHGPTSNGPTGLSSYITGTRPNCCGPVGGDGPICSELYFRIGASVNLGHTSALNDVIHTGWMVEGGYRSLFFNPEQTDAWTIEFGLSNTTNQGKFNGSGGIPLTVLVPNSAGTGTPIRFGTDVPGITLRNLNRTAANLGGGHEWYLNGHANDNCPTWRAGFDIGGRWGSANAEFNELRHRSKVFEGIWVALHTDVEIPCHCCTFLAGFRMEWDYTFSDLLQGTSDLTGINFLANFGVRY
jgi:hypothetical protein